MEKPNYYAIIPASVRYDDRLSAGAKLLYGEITALTYKEGFCWASNAYFANLYKVDNRTIRRWVEKLKKTGHVRVVITGDGDSERKLYPQDKNVRTPGQKVHKPQDKNVLQVLQVNNTINKSRSDKEENTRLISLSDFKPTFIIEREKAKKKL